MNFDLSLADSDEGGLAPLAQPLLLPPLPDTLPALGTLAGLEALHEQWLCNKALIPGQLVGQHIRPAAFNVVTRELAARRDAVLTWAALNTFARHLAKPDFEQAVADTQAHLRRDAFCVPPGLDLDGSYADNADWIEPTRKSLTAAACRLGLPPPEGEAGFVRWWNQFAVIDCLRTFSAGHQSWPALVRSLLGPTNPLGHKWWGSAAIPTAQASVAIWLRAHPELCELLSHGHRIDSRAVQGFWAVRFVVKSIGGIGLSKGIYRYGTGLKVGHLYLAALIEQLAQAAEPLAPELSLSANHGSLLEGTRVSAASDKTAAGERAGQQAVDQLKRQLMQATPAAGSAPRARRFVPPEGTKTLPGLPASTSASATGLRLTGAELQLQAAGGEALAADEVEGAIGSIRLDPQVLNPELGLSLVRLHATVLYEGKHELRLDLVDDEQDPQRVHLVPVMSHWPWRQTAAKTQQTLDLLRRNLAEATWSLVLEPDYTRVANIGMAIALRA